MSTEDEVIDLRKVDIIDYRFNSLPLRFYACITSRVCKLFQTIHGACLYCSPHLKVLLYLCL